MEQVIQKPDLTVLSQTFSEYLYGTTIYSEYVGLPSNYSVLTGTTKHSQFQRVPDTCSLDPVYDVAANTHKCSTQS